MFPIYRYEWYYATVTEITETPETVLLAGLPDSLEFSLEVPTWQEIMEGKDAPLPFGYPHTSEHPLYGRAVLHTAERLYTDEYLRLGYIQPSEVDPRAGVFRDSYAPRAVYLSCLTPREYAACRYIEPKTEGPRSQRGILSLPTARHFSLDPAVVQEVAGVPNLVSLKDSEVIELSALVSKKVPQGVPGVSALSSGEAAPVAGLHLKPTQLLYAQILRESLEKGHKLWIMNTHAQYARFLEALLGADQVHKLGEPKDYMGSETVPIAINPQKVVASILSNTSPENKNLAYLKYTFEGLKDTHLTKEMRALLDTQGIGYGHEGLSETAHYIARQKLAPHATLLTMLGYVGYTTLRAAPVAAIDGFNANPAIFWGIDTVTAVTMVAGMKPLLRGANARDLVGGGSIVGASIVAPYVYLYAEGGEFPGWVGPAVAGVGELFSGICLGKNTAKSSNS